MAVVKRPKTSVVGVQFSENNATDIHLLLPAGVLVGAGDNGRVTPCSKTQLQWMLTCHTATEDSRENGPVDENGEETLRLPCSSRILFSFTTVLSHDCSTGLL